MDTCQSCNGRIAASARVCPHCGAYRWTLGRRLGGLLVLLFGGLFAAAILSVLWR